MSFEPNCKYHLGIFYEKEINPYFKSKVADNLTKELKNLMAIYRKNL